MTEFPPNLFFDPQRSTGILTRLHELFISSASNYSIEEFSQALATALRASPDPDLAVTNLLRFVEATTSKASLFSDLIKHSMLMDVLIKLLSSSQYFADILVRDTELFRWLTASDALVKSRSKDFLRGEVERALKMFQKPERQINSLKRLSRREILRIGARDILGEATLAAITEELSHLADVLVDASCVLAHQQLGERYPNLPQTSYAVIGLGKLGGSELNYSSDIDIMFVYDREGELEDARGRTRTYHEYFNAFVEKVVVNLSQSSAQGHLYRVDTRLRPESGAGPLARSRRSYLLYYESRGELWERQMMIKARAIAGDRSFGEAFIAQLEPFVYPRTFFQNPRESIARIKARIEAEILGEENVKLRAGGIRDIEFIVQALQLMNGGKNKTVRSRNTLKAIQQLADTQLLSDDERRALTEAYTFFRTIEHRLQTMLNTQTHEMPRDNRSLTSLARKVGLGSADVLMKENQRMLTNVRRIFESVLLSKPERNDIGIASLCEGNVSLDSIGQTLARFGFSDSRKAAKNFAALLSGSSLLENRELDARATEAFREVAEKVFLTIATTPNPDMTLHDLAVIAGAHAFPAQFYHQLKEEKFQKLLLTICAKSPRLSKGLAKNPLLLETLASDAQSLAGARMISPLPTRTAIELKNQEELRSGIRYVLGITTFEELSSELTQLADVIVASAVQEEFKNSGRKKLPLAIFALGKYGTREINFNSDLDVLFVADTKSDTTRNAMEKVATKIVNRLNMITEDGKLYDVDARLRPEGKSAPLVVDKTAYRTYLFRRASLWERQSLTRLRFVAGDERVGREVLAEVQTFVYESPLPSGWLEEIVAMRKKTEARSRVSDTDFVDIKLGSGGMLDIEFIAQALQLRFGRGEPLLRHGGVRHVIQNAQRVCDIDGLEAVIPAYDVFRKCETLMRILIEERGTVLPMGEKLLLLTRELGYSGEPEFIDAMKSTMKKVREVFKQSTSQITEYT